MVLLLCVSSISVLDWQTKGTRFVFFLPFLFGCVLDWQMGGHWFESISKGARGTFFPFRSSPVHGWLRYWMRTHTHLRIYLWPLRQRKRLARIYLSDRE